MQKPELNNFFVMKNEEDLAEIDVGSWWTGGEVHLCVFYFRMPDSMVTQRDTKTVLQRLQEVHKMGCRSCVRIPLVDDNHCHGALSIDVCEPAMRRKGC